MYNTASIIFITSCIILSVNSKAIGDKNQVVEQSIYEKLLELTKKCPYLKTTKLLEPTLLTCPDYDTVSHVSILTRDTVNSVPCLLYYNSFVSLCETILTIKLTNMIDNNTIDKALKANKIGDVCVNLKALLPVSEFKNSTELIKNVTTNEHLCEKVCSEILDNTATPICTLAAYNVNMTITIRKALEKQVPQSSPVKVSDQHEQTNVKPKITPNNSNSEGPSNLKLSDEHKAPIQPELPLVEENIKPAPLEEKVEPSEPVNKPPTQEKKQEVQVDKNVNPKIVNPPDDAKVKNKTPINANLNEQMDVPNAPAVGPMPEIQSVEADKKNDVNQEISSKDVEIKPADTKLPAENNPAPLNNVAPSIADENNADNIEEAVEREDQINEGQSEELADEDGPIPDTGSDTLIKVQEKFDKAKINTKPQEINEDVLPPAYNSTNTDEEDSFFFIYFMMVCAVFILGYIGYHNKQKVLALVIEGRRGKRGSRRGRPNSANYHKLDSNLEEAVTSSCNKNPTNIIY